VPGCFPRIPPPPIKISTKTYTSQGISECPWVTQFARSGSFRTAYDASRVRSKRSSERSRPSADARRHGCTDARLCCSRSRVVAGRRTACWQLCWRITSGITSSTYTPTRNRRQRNGTTHRSRPQLFQVETEMSDFRDTAFGARHDQIFLGAAHKANERRTRAVSALAPHRRSQSTQNSGLIGVAAFRDLGWFCFVAGNSALTIPPTVCRGSRPDRLTLHRSNRYKTALQSSMHRAWTA
jgi:hypothetical protein